jgi:RNA polymerase sigma-70 factor, ECF subfamily
MAKAGNVEGYSFKNELIAQLPAMRAFAVSLCGRPDVADDLVQDAVMNAWSKQASYQEGTNIKAWLFTIVRNLFYSRMRKRGRELQDSDGFYTERLSVPPAQNGKLDLQDFRIALAKLPEDQREAIILVGATGMSYEEAAEICKCAVGTIKSRVNRARNRLQELLAVNGAEDYGPDARDASVTQRAFAS